MREVLEQRRPAWMRGPWWQRAAVEAMDRGRVHLIGGRENHDDLYLARFWLHEPKLDAEGKLESGESCLLHWILRADDDDALHDHPWDFTTTILAGSYREQFPMTQPWPRSYGPRPALCESKWRNVADVVRHPATDLHRIVQIIPCDFANAGEGVWTLVRTGERKRDWGFHPAGELWQPWRRYLGMEAATS